MTFVDVNAAAADLRDAVRAQIPKGLSDVYVRPPAKDDDEASFLRLTGWCYVFLFEAGRSCIPYLLRQPLGRSESSRHRITRDLVGRLRTWLVHNIGFESERDQSIRREIADWFMEACGAFPPTSSQHWKASFVGLCILMSALIRHCSAVLDRICASADDRDAILNGLREVVNRNWEAARFDEMVSDAAVLLGESIEARAFREPRVEAWRGFLAGLPEDADLEDEMVRRIETEVRNHFNSRLPVRAKDVMEVLGLDPGPRVGEALNKAAELYAGGMRSKADILKQLSKEARLDDV